jgi:hypothetical protein
MRREDWDARREVGTGGCPRYYSTHTWRYNCIVRCVSLIELPYVPAGIIIIMMHHA